MLRFDLSKKKKVVFDLIIEGAEYDDVTAMFRIDVDGIEYGFVGEIGPGKVTFNIPPLSEVIGTLPQHITYQARLDVIKESYMMHPAPWTESVEFEMVPKARAKYKGTGVGEGFQVKVKPSVKETVNGDSSDETILLEQADKPPEPKKPVKKAPPTKPERKPVEENRKDDDSGKIRRIVQQLTNEYKD